MLSGKKSKAIAEYGDFQTPPELAEEVCTLLARSGITPAAIVEPTCGTGTLLKHAAVQFPKSKHLVGLDINADYLRAARDSITQQGIAAQVEIRQADFFTVDWADLIGRLPPPVLVIGNPPWVTNAELSVWGSSNLPPKRNASQRTGIESITGKSNFDISEWMLLRLIEALDGSTAVVAMFCKTAVARKLLAQCWQQDAQIERAAMYGIDAARHFRAAVDACLLVCQLKSGSRGNSCDVYEGLDSVSEPSTFGYRAQQLVADVRSFESYRHLQGRSAYRWRSGIKHDCARVMELTEQGSQLKNGLGEAVEIEELYRYPMKKSSEVASGSRSPVSRWMVVTQQAVGDDTAVIQRRAPQTWHYLQRHAEILARRKSSIYRNRPSFSIFGVGSYSFAPWKLAISGFYKSMRFARLGSVSGRPTVLDDTSYFLPCRTRAEMLFLHSLLDSDPAQGFFRSQVFWDAKRPITIDLLSRLDLRAVANELGQTDQYDQHANKNPWTE